MPDEFRTRLIELLPRLRRFAHALVGDAEQGDDLVQDVCVRALARASEFEPGSRLDSWTFRIAQNIWIDRVRSARSKGTVVDLDVAADRIGVDGVAVAEGRLTLQAVNKAVTQLPEDLRVLVALICIDGVSYQEAANITGVPIGTVMSRLARARRTLHEAVTDQRQAVVSRGMEKPYAHNAR